MEQNQMSKFCIELEGMMLPDAIAAVVEAWYEVQNVETVQTDDSAINCKQRIVEITARHIQAGLLRNGSKMPSLRSIADIIGCHRNTALKVYQELETEGAIVAKAGSGFYIADANKLVHVGVF
jgi:hypothetical protein